MAYSLPDLPVVFAGRRFPSARITDEASWVWKNAPPDDAPSIGDPGTFFQIDGGRVGKGRPWDPGDTAACAWRSFVATDPADAAAVVAFLQRFGDPHSHLPERSSDTRSWQTLRRRLVPLANMWAEPDQDGVSRLAETAKPLAEERTVFHPKRAEFDVVQGMVVTASGRLEIHPPDLGSFMLLDAAGDVQRRSSFRTCRHCGHWMRVGRADAAYCDRGCRAMAAQLRAGRG